MRDGAKREPSELQRAAAGVQGGCGRSEYNAKFIITSRAAARTAEAAYLLARRVGETCYRRRIYNGAAPLHAGDPRKSQFRAWVATTPGGGGNL